MCFVLHTGLSGIQVFVYISVCPHANMCLNACVSKHARYISMEVWWMCAVRHVAGYYGFFPQFEYRGFSIDRNREDEVDTLHIEERQRQKRGRKSFSESSVHTSAHTASRICFPVANPAFYC